jgi:hypothetical protein
MPPEWGVTGRGARIATNISAARRMATGPLPKGMVEASRDIGLPMRVDEY